MDSECSSASVNELKLLRVSHLPHTNHPNATNSVLELLLCLRCTHMLLHSPVCLRCSFHGNLRCFTFTVSKYQAHLDIYICFMKYASSLAVPK